MGAIRETATGRVLQLGSHCIIGRARECALMLEPRYVSEIHAELRWTGEAWELKDLASRNGTFIDGHRVPSGHPSKVTKSSKLGFGKREHEWEVVDDSCPIPMLIPLDGGGEPIVAGEGEMFALPSEADPQVSLYKAEGGWLLERPEGVMRIVDGQTFEAIGRTWRFSCPESSNPTHTVPLEHNDRPTFVRELRLVFSVTRDEEYVHLDVTQGDRRIDMGARQHHFLLLTLARHWLAEAAAGEPEVSCGWLDQEDVAHDPSMATTRLNLSVYRIREQFAKAGVVDFAAIVQRRQRQIRIGTGRLTIERA